MARQIAWREFMYLQIFTELVGVPYDAEFATQKKTVGNFQEDRHMWDWQKELNLVVDADQIASGLYLLCHREIAW